MIAFDSSVLVAALLSWHEQHERAARALSRAMESKVDVIIPVHALIEAYAVMTRLPAPHRISPADALALLHDNFSASHLASLRTDAVFPLLKRLAADGIAGGTTYDAIILRATEEAGATSLLTLNERDYLRLTPRADIIAV